MTPQRLILLSVFLAAGCAPIARPINDHRGYVPDQEKVAAIKPGVDTKTTVATQLGTPSTAANFDGETWYYVASDQRTFLYRRPKVLKQEVLAIRFDSADLVSEVNRFDLSDAKKVDYVDRETPTRGKELSLLQQLLGNVGGVGSMTGEGENGPGPDRSPGRY